MTDLGIRSGSWWWLSFADADTGKFIGVGITFARNVDGALLVMQQLGKVPPNSRVDGAPVPPEWGLPPPTLISGLMNEDRANELARAWDPQHQGLASSDDLNRVARDPVAGGAQLVRPEFVRSPWSRRR